MRPVGSHEVRPADDIRPIGAHFHAFRALFEPAHFASHPQVHQGRALAHVRQHGDEPVLRKVRHGLWREPERIQVLLLAFEMVHRTEYTRGLQQRPAAVHERPPLVDRRHGRFDLPSQPGRLVGRILHPPKHLHGPLVYTVRLRVVRERRTPLQHDRRDPVLCEEQRRCQASGTPAAYHDPRLLLRDRTVQT